ncbi:MAG: hypothetical protein ABFD69_11915 [Candidatus Sumerlaeia bacterium]
MKGKQAIFFLLIFLPLEAIVYAIGYMNRPTGLDVVIITSPLLALMAFGYVKQNIK